MKTIISMLAATILALDTCAVYVLFGLLVCAIRDIRFGHAIRLRCAICVSSGGVCGVQTPMQGAGVSGGCGKDRDILADNRLEYVRLKSL